MVARDRSSGRCLAAALVLLLAVACSPAAAQGPTNPRLRVVVPSVGPIRGGTCPNSNAGAAYRFLGIPYAQAPTGARRFAPPVAYNNPQTTEYDARNLGPYCPQDQARGLGANLATGFSEDCLQINVWAPQNITGGRAVRVFIHGGGLSSSSGAWPAFDGCANVRDGEMLTVTFNYRLGVLGLLGLPGLAAANSSNGNWALMDVHLALQWVQTNIAAFGGDPNRVTLHAQSGGGALALATLVSPANMGPARESRLFQRLALTSPTAYTYNALSDVYAQGREFAALSNCSDTDFACLRALSVDAVIAAQRRMALSEFGPAIDGVLVPDVPFHLLSLGRGVRVPTFVTVTLDEANLAVAGTSGPSGNITAAQAATIINAQLNPPLRFRNRILSTYDASAFGGSWFAAASAAITEARYHCGTAQIMNYQATMGADVFGGIYTMPTTNGCPYQMLGLSSTLATSLGPILGAIHGADLVSVFQLPLNSTTNSAWNCGFTPQEVQMAAFFGGSIAGFVENGNPVPRDSRTPTSAPMAAVARWPRWQANFGVSSGDDLLLINTETPVVVQRSEQQVMRCRLWDEIRNWMDDNGRYGTIPTVQDFISNRTDLTLITAALRATGEWNSLTSGSNTYFLPNDAAVTALINSLNITAAELLALPTLRDILRYHVIPTPIDVVRGNPPRQRVIMASGRPAYVMRTDDTVRVLDVNLNAARVLHDGRATIAGRSYVNVVDRVLMPTCSA